ncbi:hypothetical protein HN51_060029 [Arachis hypogaea]
MALKTCFTLLHHSQHSSSKTIFSFPSFNSASCILHNEPHNNHILHFSTFFTKRELLLTLLLTIFLSSNLSNTSGALLMAQELDLELHRYTDSKEELRMFVFLSVWYDVLENDSIELNGNGMRDPWDMIDFYADEPPQFQFESPPLPEPWNGDQNNVGDPQLQSCAMDSQLQPCAIDVCGNQQPQLPSQPVIDEYFPEVMKRTEHYCGSPLSGYQPHQSQPQSCPIDVCVRMATNEFFADTCGYPPPQPQPQTEWDTRNMIPNVGSHQLLQPQPPVWTWEENKAFESVITSCFQDALHNHREAVAARLPGRTPAQLQERFQKLMNGISAIHNGYPSNTPLNAASDNMTIMMEHNPPSIPIINATTPPPLPPYSTDHHHREEVLSAAEEELVPTAGEEAAPTKTRYHWTQDEHRNCALFRGF